MEPKRLDDFGVTEVQHRVALFHHGYLGAKRGEDRGVLDADHAGPDHDHRRRNGFELNDFVGVQHPIFVEGDAIGSSRCRSGRDDDEIGGNSATFGFVGCFDADGVLVDEAAVPGEKVDAIAHNS